MFAVIEIEIVHDSKNGIRILVAEIRQYFGTINACGFNVDSNCQFACRWSDFDLEVINYYN